MEAVFHTEGLLLILIGAGSGKAKVLTMKIVYLIAQLCHFFSFLPPNPKL